MAWACFARALRLARISRSSASIAVRWPASSDSSSLGAAAAMSGARLLFVALFVRFRNALQARELFAIVQVDQRHTLRRPAHFADRLHTGPNQYANHRVQQDSCVS